MQIGTLDWNPIYKSLFLKSDSFTINLKPIRFLQAFILWIFCKYFNPFQPSVAFHIETGQIKWPVSIWNAIMGWNGLRCLANLFSSYCTEIILHLGESIQEWTKRNLRKTTFKKIEVPKDTHRKKAP